MNRVILLARSKAPFPDSRTHSSRARYAYHRFAEALTDVGFEVETANQWPAALPDNSWLLLHMSVLEPDIRRQVEAQYGAAACARAVAMQLRFPDGYRAVASGAALSIGAEAYAAWLRGTMPAPDAPGFVITSRRRAEACSLPIFDAQGDAVLLAGGVELPRLLWQCFSIDPL